MELLKIVLALSCIVYALAQAPECESTSVCDLPDCKCSNTKVPGGLDPKTIPQIIVLTFDDDVNVYNYNKYYVNLFNYTNPHNQCPIGITFFVSHEYTDYDLVHDLWQRGHEMASHSISHNALQTYWQSLNYTGWEQEMAGQADIISIYANIPRTEIVGDRAPQLVPGGNYQFHALEDTGFLWDSSLPTNRYTNPAMWPYTLDYLSTQDCEIPVCPTDEIDGFWVNPMVDRQDANGIYCAMDDACTAPGDTQPTFDYLQTNFLSHYNSNRAPFGIYIHSAWFDIHNDTWTAYRQFIEYALALPDTYFLTMSDSLKWVRNPVAFADLPTDFWTCEPKTSTCNLQSCYYPTTPLGTGERYMNSCVPCPPTYPWLGNPQGN